MENQFYEFWRLYAPAREYHNRYLACQRLWNGMDEEARRSILEELRKEPTERSSSNGRQKNPYFYLVDWQPHQPHWLTPTEVGYLESQHVAMAVCLNPLTQRYGAVTKAEAEKYGLQVHHFL